MDAEPRAANEARPDWWCRVLCMLLLALSCGLGLDLTRFRVARADVVRQSLSVGSEARFQDADEQWPYLLFEPGYSLLLDSRSDTRNLNWTLDADAWLQRDRLFTDSRLTLATGYSLESYVRGGAVFVGPSAEVSVTPAYRVELDKSVQRRTLEIQAEAHPGLAFGVGRIRDAWPLLKARRISDILVAEGVIDRGMSDDELLDLSQFISRAWRLFALHDRPARFYYDSLETRLRQRGTIAAGLPAHVLMRLDENLYAGTYRREFGVRFHVDGTASLKGQYQAILEPHAEPSLHGTANVSGAATFEFARPFGLRWTTTAELSYHPVGYSGEGLVHKFDIVVGISYQVLDRLDLFLTQMSVANTAGRSEPADYSSTTTLGTHYYVEDQLGITAGLGAWFNRTDRGIRLGFEFGYGRRW